MDELTLNKRLVSESVERIWHDRRLEDLERFVTADFVDHSAPQGASRGADGFLDGVKKVLAAFPDAKNHIDDIFAEGDRVVVRWTMTGTNTGDGLGFSPTGRAVRFSGITISRIVGGRIAEHWSFRDDLTMLRQLGFLP